MRIPLIAASLALLSAVCGCAPSGRTDSEDRVVFVREGIVCPGDASSRIVLNVTSADNTTVRLTSSLPVGGRVFFRFAWEPGGRYALRLISGEGAAVFSQALTAPVRPEPLRVAAVRLEGVHAGSVTSGGEPDASLSFSADGTLLAVGTFGGYLRAYDTRTGEAVFEKHIPGAVVKQVAVSPDNSRIYAGEMSYDGFVRAFDVKSKRELWRFRLADELETSKPARADDFFALYSYPQAYCMRSAGDDLIVDGFHSWRHEGKPRHLSRIYRFAGRTGEVLWRFPEDKPLRRNISWFDTDGELVAFSAYQWEAPPPGDPVPQAAVYLLDAASGKMLARHGFEPLAPHFNTAPMWYGLALDDSGHLAVGLMDGRGAIFDTRPGGAEGRRALRLVRKMELATPVEVTGVPIYAGAGWAAGSGNTLYVLTDGRLIAPSAGVRGKTVRADHPAANTIFAFDGASGKLLWRWKLTTTAQGIAAGKGVLAASTQQSFSSDDPMDYGLTVFDTRRGCVGTPVEKLLFRYHTAGPVVALAVSPDGKTVAVVEAPVRLPDGITVVGKYRLHILR